MMSKNVSEERIKILEMVEEGKIDASGAMELLSALERNQEEIVPKNDAKWLRVRVKTMENESKVNVNIPLALVDVGLKLAKTYDPKLKESGLDKIDIEEIMDAVKNGAEGKIVEVEDEENQTRVKVYVE
ncbi:SHOCT-like domain-containing protein [Methanobacterium sp. MBAC-LM]|uniref:SHOCT-like domain-containing protein n=1 Tax=Methanobacterium sp. MBAC-LM TaxID=3412034 RepID=UPI003C742009